MKKRLLFVLVLSFIATLSAAAQNRTVTNSDLEKFRAKRLAAEKDLRENYERLGFPSPAELERQREQSRAERAALTARLEAENLERERINLEREIIEAQARNNNQQYPVENYQPNESGYFYNYAPNGFYNFPNFGFPNYRSNRFNRGGFRGGYRGNYDNQPRIEYRNNLPVIITPPRPIFSPPISNGRRH